MPNLCDRAKIIIKEDAAMAVYNEKEQLYLETDTSDVDLTGSLMQVRDGMQSPRYAAPNNATLWPIMFCKQKPDQH